MRTLIILTGIVFVFSACGPSRPPLREERFGVTIANARIDPTPEGPLVLDVTFDNVGRCPAYLIEPQTGSFEGWLHPIYDVDIRPDGGGRRVEIPYTTGILSARYDSSTMHLVPPGGSKTIEVRTPYVIEKPGRYDVKLRYFVEAVRYPGPKLFARSAAALLDKEEKEGFDWREWPRGVFVGRAYSNVITISVE